MDNKKEDKIDDWGGCFPPLNFDIHKESDQSLSRLDYICDYELKRFYERKDI